MKLQTIDNWDGILPGCLGKECPTPCCNVKKVPGTDGKVYDYIAMVNEGEKKKIMETGIPATFQSFERATSYDMHTFEARGEVSIALQGGCLGADGCLIPHAKPSSCKSYPYQVNIDDPSGLPQIPFDLFGCPSAANIVSNEQNTKNVLEARKSAGYPDNKKYIEALIFALSMLGAPDPKWKFLDDKVYMEAIL